MLDTSSYPQAQWCGKALSQCRILQNSSLQHTGCLGQWKTWWVDNWHAVYNIDLNMYMPVKEPKWPDNTTIALACQGDFSVKKPNWPGNMSDLSKWLFCQGTEPSNWPDNKSELSGKATCLLESLTYLQQVSHHRPIHSPAPPPLLFLQGITGGPAKWLPLEQWLIHCGQFPKTYVFLSCLTVRRFLRP